MAVATTSTATLSAIELNSRRLAVENAIGSLRIENMEIDATPRSIMDRYASGELSLDEMNEALSAYSATIV